MTLEPIIRNDVPWNAVRMRKMKNAAKFGASALPILNAVNKIALNSCGHRRPYTMPIGPQKTGESPMKS